MNDIDDDFEECDFKNAIYEIYDPSGTFVSYCPRKRFYWYINKEPQIAKTMDNKKNAVQLLFEPEFRGKHIKKFVKREYICSVCGTKENIKVIHVICSNFRKYFPVHKKSHNSSDIIYLCNCDYKNFNSAMMEYKLDLMEQYDIYLDDFEDLELKKIVNLAKKIIIKKSKKQSNNTLLNNIVDYQEKNNCIIINNIQLSNNYIFTDNDYTYISQIQYSKEINNCKNVEEYIVTKCLTDDKKIDEFTLNYKKYFTEKLEANYLPIDFYIDYEKIAVVITSDIKNALALYSYLEQNMVCCVFVLLHNNIDKNKWLNISKSFYKYNNLIENNECEKYFSSHLLKKIYLIENYKQLNNEQLNDIFTYLNDIYITDKIYCEENENIMSLLNLNTKINKFTYDVKIFNDLFKQYSDLPLSVLIEKANKMSNENKEYFKTIIKEI